MTRVVLLLLAFVLFASAATVVERLQADTDFNSLVAFINTLGAQDTVNGLTDNTLFAPTNEAFENMPPGTETNLDLLLNHAIQDVVLPAQISNNLVAPAISTLNLRFNIYGEGTIYTVNGIVITPGVEEDGLAIHKINRIIVGVPPLQNIYDLANGLEDFRTLITAVNTTGLDGALSSEEATLTVFAPTNEAFGQLPESLVATLLEPVNNGLLAKILRNHVVDEVYYSAGLSDGVEVPALYGSITIGINGSVVTANGAIVSAVDITASNGVIHVLDSVMVPTVTIPETLVLQEKTELVTLLRNVDGLFTVLEEIEEATLFAPTNAAIQAIEGIIATLTPEQAATILQYHVISGAVPSTALENDLLVPTLVDGTFIRVNVYPNMVATINGKVVSDADAMATNGLVHTIDGVLIPPTTNIFQFLNSSADFTILTQAIEAAGLVELLSTTPNNFTLFAPTDESFAPFAEYLPELLANPEALSAVLSYHVIPTTVFAAGFSAGEYPTALTGSTIAVTITDDGVILNGQNPVVMPDIIQTNGVVHVIGGLLIPPGFNPFPDTNPTTVAPTEDSSAFGITLSAALVAASLVATL